MEKIKDFLKINKISIIKILLVGIIVALALLGTINKIGPDNFIKTTILINSITIIHQALFIILGINIIILIGLYIFTQSKTLGVKIKSIPILDEDLLTDILNNISGLTNKLLSILVFFSGVVLLTSSLVPGIASRIKLATRLMSFPILQLSNQLSIIVGILLVAISKDIAMKVKRSYKFTLWLLLLGGIFTFLKGFDYEEAIFLGIALILLRMSKKSFYRRSTPFDWFWTLVSSIFILIGLIIYFRLSHIIIRDLITPHNIKSIIIRGLGINSLIIYIAFIGFLIIREVTKEDITKDPRYEVLDAKKTQEHLESNGGSLLSHLVFLNDKHIFWAKSNKVIITFEKSHNVVIALGDPIGDAQYFGEAIDEFQSFIDEYGYKSIFYEVSDRLFSLYHDHGYHFFKLGETALVNLIDFDISSPKSRDFRNILSRFKRDRYEFQLDHKKEIDNELYKELLNISDEWLEDRKEMGFSLGFMDRNYLKHSPLAIIKKTDTNEIIAFASLMPKYDNNKTMSIDLMRFKKHVPSNAMAFLILNIIIGLKEDGYEVLNLGMAPLSNVGGNPNAHFKEKLAHLVFKYGNNIYSFSGLRRYKEKFNPNWENRYLAYEDLGLLPSSLIEATILIYSKK